MSTSWNCEQDLRDLATKLHADAYDLEKAADVLAVLRDAENRSAEIAAAKRYAKDWMKP